MLCPPENIKIANLEIYLEILAFIFAFMSNQELQAKVKPKTPSTNYQT